MTADGARPSDPFLRRGVLRWQVVQAFLDMFDGARYLEIGVSRGDTFHEVAADQKVAVDPAFRFDWEAEQKQRVGTRYFPVTSDEYFGAVVDPSQEFDVVYLDGLHTFEQTLRDLMNALEHLQPRGVIVIDDVRPVSFQASLPNLRNFRAVRKYLNDPRGQWMGDVYKLVWFIDSFCQSLSYATVSNNHGQAVLWRGRRESVVERSMGTIAAMTFEDFVLQTDVLRLRPLGEIVEEVRDVVGTALASQDS
jgi:hypothetical protein